VGKNKATKYEEEIRIVEKHIKRDEITERQKVLKES
jgi:hypothetical protein